MYKKILIAIDGSDASMIAVQEAAHLIKQTKAQVMILHVIEEHSIYPGIDYLALLALYQKAGQEVLNNARNILVNQGIDCDIKLVQFDQYRKRTSEIIIEEAQNYVADLLILGTHGRQGFSRLFLGSVAENAIRISPIPVLLVPSTISPQQTEIV